MTLSGSCPWMTRSRRRSRRWHVTRVGSRSFWRNMRNDGASSYEWNYQTPWMKRGEGSRNSSKWYKISAKYFRRCSNKYRWSRTTCCNRKGSQKMETRCVLKYHKKMKTRNYPRCRDSIWKKSHRTPIQTPAWMSYPARIKRWSKEYQNYQTWRSARARTWSLKWNTYVSRRSTGSW